MTNLDSILNSRDITLPTKFHQSYVFSSMYVRVELSTEELMLLYCGVGEDSLPGASVRNSTHGKGHEEGGFGICKGGIEAQETPCSRASTPKTRVYLLYCFMLSPIPLTLQEADPHYLSRRRS